MKHKVLIWNEPGKYGDFPKVAVQLGYPEHEQWHLSGMGGRVTTEYIMKRVGDNPYTVLESY